MRNGHMNLFRAYSGGEHIENNLTRALAICLEKDALFLRLFLQHKEVLDDQAAALFAHLHAEESNFVVDVQRDVTKLPGTEQGITRVIGLTLTTSAEHANFEGATAETEKRQITDVLLQIQDVLIVIEAKRHGGDAAEQLKKQLQGLPKEITNIRYASLSWEEVLGLVQNAQHTYQLLGQSDWLLDSFHRLIEQNYAHWLPTKPFKFIPFQKGEAINTVELNKRLAVVRQQIKQISGYDLEEMNDRVAIKVNWGWAEEVLMWFREQQELGIFVFPGNTKWQGYQLYPKAREGWDRKTQLQVDGQCFPLLIYPQIKFYNSFGKNEAGLEFGEWQSQIIKPMHHWAVFEKYSGQWSQKKPERTFADLEQFLDDHISPDFDWRGKVEWEKRYKNNPNRSSLSISFGYIVMVTIPYHQLQALDKTDADKTAVAQLLAKVVDALAHLIE